MARLSVAVLTLCLAIPIAASAQKPKTPRASKSTTTRPPIPTPPAPALPPSPDSLSAITRRGTAVQQHDQAAWLATGAMTLPFSHADGVRRLIAKRTDRGWEVALGQLSSSGNEFLVSRLATPGIQATWASQLFEPPRRDTGYFARAGRAIESALVMFHPVAERPHIATVIPAHEGPWWWVYVYPASLQEGVWPRGGDMRFRVSADGRVVMESRRLHEEITEYSVRNAGMNAVTSDGASIVKGDVPEDTDVFHILQRRPPLPELMTAGKYRYRIDVDGRITMLGTK